MGTAVIGRFLATSLYQAISELLPVRLGFYESWLTPRGFRAKHVYLSGVRAVFSFLRTEAGQYDAVMRRAGALSTRWIHDDLPPLRRRLLRAVPRPLRGRAALLLARHVIRETWGQSRPRVHWRRGGGRLTIASSLFCDVRDSTPAPLCAFYAAVVEASLELAGVAAAVQIERCRAQSGSECVITVEPVPAGHQPATAPASEPGAPPAAASSSGASPRASLSALALLMAAALAVPAGAQPPAAAAERALIMPFENLTKQPALAWLSEGTAILLADDLRAAGVGAMSHDERLSAFERFQVPPLAALSRATVIRIGELVGADDVVIGSVGMEAGQLVLSARRIHLAAGRMDAERGVRGAPGDLPRLVGDLRRALWSGASERVPPAVPARPASAVPLPAFEQYVKGLLAATPSARASLLANAIALYTDFPDARIALAQARASAGEHRLALEALKGVGDEAPRAFDARFLEGVAHIALRDYAAAYQALAAIQARTPSALALNDLGVVRIRAASLPPGAGSAAWYFSQARALDPLDPDYLFNLGYAYWLDGDLQGASYWLREAVRVAPTDASAHALLAQALHAAGQPAEAARELALAQRLSSDFEGTVLRDGAPPGPPRGLERLKDSPEAPRARRIGAALDTAGQREQRDLAAFYLERGRRAYGEERDRDAESDLTRVLYLSPYEAEAHMLLGRAYLRTGRLREAIDALKVSIWSRDSAAARVALAEAYLEARDPAAALVEAERALAMDPGSVHARQLLERLRR